MDYDTDVDIDKHVNGFVFVDTFTVIIEIFISQLINIANAIKCVSNTIVLIVG